MDLDSGVLPPQSGVHIAPSGRIVAMKTCPICGTKAFLATRRCKAECGWNFTEKTIDRADGGSAARQLQERKRAAPPPAPITTVQGNVTTHTNISPEDDGNMDSCIICGDMGMLICCDLCPLSYHADCAGLDKVPLGFWSCPQCTQKNIAVSVSVDGAAAARSTAASGVRGAMPVPMPVGSGIQSGLDPFHQRLNACLDYTNTQTYECEGYTFMCFMPPDINLMSNDPVKQQAAQAKFDAIKAEQAAKAAALQAAQAAAAQAATPSPSPLAATTQPTQAALATGEAMKD